MSEIKVTKKDIQEAKRPDAVLEASTSAYDWLVERRSAVLGGLVAVLVLIGVVSLVRANSESKGREAGAELSRAVELKARPVVEGSAGAEKKADAEKSFPSRDARSAAVEGALAAVAKARVGTPAARLSGLLQAQVALEAGKADEAIAGLRAFVDSGDAFGLSVAVNEALGYAYEAKKDWAQAQAAFEKAGTPARVAFHKARLLEAQGKKDEARAAYGAIAEGSPTDPVSVDARVRLELLDMPAAGTGAFEPAPAAEAPAKPAARRKSGTN